MVNMILVDIKVNFKVCLTCILIGCSFASYTQTNSLELNPEKEKIFSTYMLWRHGGSQGLSDFKKNNKYQYLKELWYYSESFYIKRDSLKEGVAMNESAIDISRFENYRKENEEAIVILPGFKDALVLLPNNKLIYKP
jgi:hypothetical protein